MNIETRKLIELLDQTFNKGAWHGPSVMEALEGVSQEQANRRLPDTHSIMELVAHMTSWRIYVIKKLEGDSDYQVADKENFPAVTDWDATVGRLADSQRQLIDSLRRMTDEKLNDAVPGIEKRLTFYTLLHSIVHHDLYHAGQISLIKKATAKQTI